MHVIYTGERVRLRPFADFAEANRVLEEDYSVPDPFRGPRWRPVTTRQSEFRKSGMLDHDAYSISAIERLDTGALVGISGCSAHRGRLLSMSIGTYILQEHRGLGFGIEAKQLMLCRLFENFPLEAVRSSTMEHHEKARGGLEASGFRCYGRLRGIEWAEGRYYDEVQYEIFREEWERLPIRDLVKRG